MMPSDIKRKLKEAIRRYKTDWRSDVKEVAKYQIDTITKQYPEEAATVKRFEGYRDSKMTKNSLMKFIDSCVGNIARKIEDEFRESDHPRDRGGKFTSKGGEGRGGGSSTRTSTGRDDILSELYTNGQGGVSKKEIRSVLNMLTDNEVDPEDTTTIKNIWEGAGIDPDKKDIKLTQQYLKNYHSKGGGGKEEKYSSRKAPRGRGDDWMSENYEKEQLSTGNEGIDLENELMGEDDTRTGTLKQAEHYKNTLNKPYLERVSPELAKEARTKIHQALEDEIRQIAENSADKEEFKINLDAFLEDYVQDDMADTDERAADNFGYDKETVHAVAEEMKGEIDSIANDFFEEDDDDTSVTGPEDKDYMNEEDDDENSASKDVKSVRSALDEELFELATTSESEEEFKSKVKHRFNQYRRLLKDDRTNELPVSGKRAEYALKKIQSEIDSGTSEYW